MENARVEHLVITGSVLIYGRKHDTWVIQGFGIWDFLDESKANKHILNGLAGVERKDLGLLMAVDYKIACTT